MRAQAREEESRAAAEESPATEEPAAEEPSDVSAPPDGSRDGAERADYKGQAAPERGEDAPARPKTGKTDRETDRGSGRPAPRRSKRQAKGLRPRRMGAPRPRRASRSGDDSPAKTLVGYLARMSGPHQVGLCLLAVLVALFDLIPLEIQRRLIDDAIAPGNAELLWQLALLYGLVIAMHQILKLALRLYQGWVSESAIVHTRRHSLKMRVRAAETARASGKDESEGRNGVSAVVLGAEIDRLGGFVGAGVSDACANFSILIGVFAYMTWTEPQLALVCAVLLAPQALAAPLLQGRLNRLMSVRFRLLRNLGARADETRAAMGRVGRLLPRIYGNRLAITLVKFGMKGILNILNQAGPLAALAYGGWLVIEGQTTVGVVVSFVSAFQRLSAPLRQLLTFYRQWQQAQVQHELVAGWMSGGPAR